MKIVPIAFDSLGTRSMCTFVETDDCKILVDPGVALAPSRYGLPPHAFEWQRLNDHFNRIQKYAGKADVIIITHYHYDHHTVSATGLYEDKVLYIKHPTEWINFSQRERASYFLSEIGGRPKRLECSDGKEFQHGKTKIKFSNPVCHGTNPRLGYVTEVSISCGGEKILFTSDVEGPSLPDQTQFILGEKPDIVILDGPMTYMLGFRYSWKSLQISIENMVKIIRETPAHTLMLEHHFIRDLQYKSRIKPVYDVAGDKGVKVITAAEYLGCSVEMLEARRRELYKKYPQAKSTEAGWKVVFEE
ncbi:MBL fold metallo-hydrolase [Candidatus Bathyarchaeota archaeon]|nr:MBL fold metallo-hydrolase [Candidatus Bathyarchaeota archaeon]